MAENKPMIISCNEMVYISLSQYSCQTAKQLKTFIFRKYNKEFAVGSISSALKKLVQCGKASYSENEKGQKVYWLTEYGKLDNDIIK